MSPAKSNALSRDSGASGRARIFAVYFFMFAISLLAVSLPLYSQTELGSEDDLTILGTSGTALDPDTEIKGFSVFGSTQAAYTGTAAGPGNVVVNGVLAVSSGAYFVANSTFAGGTYMTGVASFTNVGNIFIAGGADNQVLAKDGAAGPLKWASASALGDNLGNHTATGALNLAGFNIAGVSTITVSSITTTAAGITISTNLFVMNGNLGIGIASPIAKLHVGPDVNGRAMANIEASFENSYLVLGRTGDYATIVNKNDGTLRINHTGSSTDAHLVILSTGSVGIGTAGPAYRLHVSSGAGETGTIMAVSTGASNLFWVAGDGAHAVKFFGDGSGLTGVGGSDNLGNHTATTHLNMAGKAIFNASSMTINGAGITGAGPLFTVAGSTLNILANGKVGIGVTNPTGVLHISNSDAAATANLFYVSSGAAAGQELLALKRDGRLGIGQVTDYSGVKLASDGGLFIGSALPASTLISEAPLTTSRGIMAGRSMGNYLASELPEIRFGETPLTPAGLGDTSVLYRTSGVTMLRSGATAANALTLLDNGNVGISTNSPAARLDVKAGGSAATDFAQIWRNSAGTIVSSVSATGVMMAAKFIGDGTGLTGLAGNDNLGNHTATQNLSMAGFDIVNASSITVADSRPGLTISTNLYVMNGNVGIGTTNPTGKLTIGSGQVLAPDGIAAAPGYSWTSAPDYGIYLFGGNDIRIGAAGTGQVWIGQTRTRFSSQIQIASGNSGAPGINFSNDTNTGIFSPNPDLLAFSVGGIERMRFDTAGNVGIGTTTPLAALNVVSTGTAATQMAQVWGNTSGAIVSSMSATGVMMATKFVGDGSGITGTGDNLGNHAATTHLDMANKAVFNVSSLTITGSGMTGVSPLFKVAGSTLNILANGYVGIGVVNPAYQLDVSSNIRLTSSNLVITNSGYAAGAVHLGTNGQTSQLILGPAGNAISVGGRLDAGELYLASGSNSLTGTNSSFSINSFSHTTFENAATYGNGAYVFKIIGAEKMRIETNGNVGISTGAPQARLDVLSAGSAPTDMAQLWRNSAGTIISSVSATGVITASKFVGDGSGLTGVSGSDNLGNHTATQALNLAGFNIAGVSTITVSSITTTAAGITISTNLFVMNGNLGIGTTNPTVQLHVVGVSSFTDKVYIPENKLYVSSGAVGQVLKKNAGGWLEWGYVGVPTGTITFFDLPGCPGGWTEVTSAQGRYIVGLPSGGTLAGTNGTALSNLEDRATGGHNHSTTDPGHVHDLLGDASGGDVVVGADSGSASHNGSYAGNVASHVTGLTINNFGVAGTNAPYIQYRACKCIDSAACSSASGGGGSTQLAVNLAGGAAGSVVYQSGESNTTFLNIGANNTVLTSNGSVPAWNNAPALAGTNFTGIVDGALSSNVALLTGAQTFTGAKTFSAAASFPGSGIWNASGSVGVGTTDPGAKLEVQGQVKIVDTTQGAGKVLTSDVNGLASWQTPGAGSGDNLGSHVATTTLNMSEKPIIGVSSMNLTATGLTGSNPVFRVAGSTFVINNDGNAGIGTTLPGYALDIYRGADKAMVNLQGAGDTWNYSGFNLWSDEVTDKYWSLSHRKAAGEENRLLLEEFDGTTYKQRMVLAPNGTVSFNNPGTKTQFELQGAGDAYNYTSFIFWNNDWTKYWAMMHRKGAGETNNFHIEEYDGATYSPRLSIKPGGNVGIATTAPDQKLTVAGSISQTGVLISSGTGNSYFAGNVGIGTTAPDPYKLAVSNPGGSTLQVDTSNAAYVSLRSNGVEVLRLKP